MLMHQYKPETTSREPQEKMLIYQQNQSQATLKKRVSMDYYIPETTFRGKKLMYLQNQP